MVLYKCNTCLKVFNRKSSFDNHLKRKKPCTPPKILNDIISSTTELNSARTIKCNYCERNYKRNSELNRHLKTCKIKLDKEFKKNTFTILLNKINNLNVKFENQSNIMKDLQYKIEGSVKVNDVKDIIKSLKKDIKLNRTEIIHLKYKT
jgi:hypothetical protein